MQRRASIGRVVSRGCGTDARPNTVGLGAGDLESLLGQLDATSGSAAAAQREFARWVFRAPSIEMQFRHSSGSSLALRVACRNLSCGGISVLHNAYVHVGTQCTVTLPRPRTEPVVVSGRVVRCEHRQGMVHELGIMFASPIRIRDFCAPGPLVDRFSFERVNPADLRGTLLVVTGSELQRRLIGHYLTDGNVNIRVAESRAAALQQDLATVDVIIADHELEDGEPRELLQEVRASGHPVSFVQIVPKSQEIDREGDTVAPDAFLRSPLENQAVLRALAEFMIGPTTSQSAEASAAGPGLRADVARECLALKTARDAGDAIGCYSVCMNLRSAAAAAGVEQITRLAGRASKSLGEDLNLEGVKADLDAIIEAGRSVDAAETDANDGTESHLGG